MQLIPIFFRWELPSEWSNLYQLRNKVMTNFLFQIYKRKLIRSFNSFGPIICQILTVWCISSDTDHKFYWCAIVKDLLIVVCFHWSPVNNGSNFTPFVELCSSLGEFCSYWDSSSHTETANACNQDYKESMQSATLVGEHFRKRLKCNLFI